MVKSERIAIRVKPKLKNFLKGKFKDVSEYIRTTVYKDLKERGDFRKIE